jgi:hypothetical protein
MKVAIIVVVIVFLVLFVLPLGGGRMTDGGTTFYTPLIHWYLIYDHNTRKDMPAYVAPHDGSEEPATTKLVSGGIEVYLFGQKVYDSSYMNEVPMDS